MDFEAIVRIARQLHSKGVDGQVQLLTPIEPTDHADTIGLETFGRICNTDDPCPPSTLSSTPGRQTVFVFGPDSVHSIILKQNTYDCLKSLGFDHDYIYHEVVEKKCSYWLVLFTSRAIANLDKSSYVVPATWEGILHIVKTCYPDAYKDTLLHFDELRSKSVSDFEKEAGFQFLDAKKNITGCNPSGPPFHSYVYFNSLPSPRKAWEVRLFLYCELRLLSLFKGDGYTQTEDGGKGTREYLCPNVPMSDFDPTHTAVIPMTVTIPKQ